MDPGEEFPTDVFVEILLHLPPLRISEVLLRVVWGIVCSHT